jgi:hypothetical protein
MVNNNTRLIALSRGEYAIVDAVDYDWLSQWKWTYSSGYARRTVQENGKEIRVYMHRQILNPLSCFLVDHINRNKLDNRKSNLRLSNKSLNAANSKVRIDNTSGFKGVAYNSDLKKWVAKLNRQHIGVFYSKEEAALAYNARAIEVYGEFITLNKV